MRIRECIVCNLPIIYYGVGRPRRYCGPRCKYLAKEWTRRQYTSKEVRSMISRAAARAYWSARTAEQRRVHTIAARAVALAKRRSRV